jgi:hypothetical protein
VPSSCTKFVPDLKFKDYTAVTLKIIVYFPKYDSYILVEICVLFGGKFFFDIQR